MTGNYLRSTSPFLCAGEEQFVQVVDECQNIQRCRWPSKKVLESTICPISWAGCHIEEIGVSPSGNWLVTQRISGQGEWGYDVFRTAPLERATGITQERGYILELPRFSENESLLVGGASRFFEWWWDGDEENDGPAIVGFLFVHHLPRHDVTRHELRVELPKGWKPEDPRAKWYGPRDITPIGEGVRLVPSGGLPVEVVGPLPPVIVLPTPHPSGRGFL